MSQGHGSQADKDAKTNSLRRLSSSSRSGLDILHRRDFLLSLTVERIADQIFLSLLGPLRRGNLSILPATAPMKLPAERLRQSFR
jgi:hypothetical protein